MKYFVSGIGTEVGKTVASAVLVQALEADYWKPVQCGSPKDIDTVTSLVSHSGSIFHQGVFLQEPASPHQAASNQGVHLELKHLKLPPIRESLIIEGAGGLMVPLNDDELMIDMAKKFSDGVILVVKIYLGCINHSLLSIKILEYHQVPLFGLIFNGPQNEHTKQIIMKHSQAPELIHLTEEQDLNPSIINRWARQLKQNWT